MRHHNDSNSGILSLSWSLVSCMAIAVSPWWVISSFQALNQLFTVSLFCGHWPRPRLRTFCDMNITSSLLRRAFLIFGCFFVDCRLLMLWFVAVHVGVLFSLPRNFYLIFVLGFECIWRLAPRVGS